MIDIINGTGYLYRVLSLDKFVKMLEVGKNVLVRPTMWEDPWEKIVSNAKFNWNNEYMEIDAANFKKHSWFGQCWSKEEVNDTIWRIFTPDRNERKIRIKVSFENLRKEYYKYQEAHDGIAFFCNEIRYAEPNEESFGDEISKVISDYTSQRITITTEEFNILLELGILMTKRKAFEYEKELRLLVYVESESNEENLFTYDCNFPAIVEDVELDPWTPKGEIEEIKEKLSMYFNDEIIHPSDLYVPFEEQTSVNNITINPSHKLLILTENCKRELKNKINSKQYNKTN